MEYHRSAGILLHPTSLPGPYGIGDIGPEAIKWIDFLADSGFGLWQVLPLGPTGFGDSPYQCFSANAGNPYLISPEILLSENFLHSDDLVDHPKFSTGKVDFGAVIPWKLGVLNRAYIRFKNIFSTKVNKQYDEFIKKNAEWLGDFALFMAIKEAHGGGSWIDWPSPLRNRHPKALEEAKRLRTERTRH